MFLYVFFYNIIEVNHYLHSFITLLHLISSFLLIRSFLVPYAYVSLKLTDYILLSPFALKEILFISVANIFSVKTFNEV